MKTVLLVLVSLSLGLGIGWIVFQQSEDSETGKRKVLYYQNPMNPTETSQTPMKASDGKDYIPVYEEKEASINLTTSENHFVVIDPSIVQKMGVQIDTVKKGILSRNVRTVGKVEVDETKQRSINSKINGWVEKLYIDFTGKSVSKGQPLMEIYSPELVSTQEEYLQALVHEEHMENSTLSGAKTGAVSLVESAKRRLKNWDISDTDIKKLEDSEDVKKTMTLYSPSNGFVLDKMVVQGQNISSGMELLKLADLSTVWILADVYQHELSSVKIGQNVDVELSYLSGKKFAGKVTFIYPTMNEETKTAKIRIEVKNSPQIEFKPGMFATVEINSTSGKQELIVSDQSIIRTGKNDVVIVSIGGGKFDPREVTLGNSFNGYSEVLNGLHAGESYVVSSQFLIDSESNIKTAIKQMLNQEQTKTNLRENLTDSNKEHQHKGSVWVCPMHPNIVREEAGHCPICNMTLVEKKI